MRRVGNLWPQIVCFENLLRATRNAARGKRQVRSVARFLERAEYEVLSIERDLVSKTYTPGRPTSFKIRDPKERTITVVPFRDRVVHHALIDPLESIFDRRMIPESFACRRGKGNHAALRYAQGLLRQYRYFLKLDIERYFETLSHKVVMETLQRLVKDKNVLWLCDRIVRAQGFRGRGLPIGNLTSQWFANLVLDRVDRYAKEVLRVPGYVRYMDDFVLFAEKRERLKESLGDLRDFLDSSLRSNAFDGPVSVMYMETSPPGAVSSFRRFVVELIVEESREPVKALTFEGTNRVLEDFVLEDFFSDDADVRSTGDTRQEHREKQRDDEHRHRSKHT
jgi:retron-type reverse transcriptase